MCTDGWRRSAAWSASGRQKERGSGVLVRGKTPHCLPKRLSAPTATHHDRRQTHFLLVAFPHRFAPFYLNTSFDCMLFLVLCFALSLNFSFIFSFLHCCCNTSLFEPFFPLFSLFFSLLSCLHECVRSGQTCLSVCPALPSFAAATLTVGMRADHIPSTSAPSSGRMCCVHPPPRTGFLYL